MTRIPMMTGKDSHLLRRPIAQQLELGNRSAVHSEQTRSFKPFGQHVGY